MLELEHIQKAFDGVPVLKDLSLQVDVYKRQLSIRWREN